MRKIWSVALLVFAIQPAFAVSQAVDFANRAGTIAGIAQACGQDVSVLNNRVGDAVQSLATDNTDATVALQTYQQTRETQYNAQKANNAAPCAQVLQDYATLPILRDDYRDTVIPKLKQANVATTTTTPITQTPGGQDNLPQNNVPTYPGSTTHQNTYNSLPVPGAPQPGSNPGTSSQTPVSPGVGPVIVPPANNDPNPTSAYPH